MDRTAQVEFDFNDDLLIHELRVPVSQDLREWIDLVKSQQESGVDLAWEDAISDALRLGAMMMVRAHAAVALDFVKKQAQEVTAEVDSCFSDFREKTGALFTDPKDPQGFGPVAHQFKNRLSGILEPVESTVNDALASIKRHVDPHAEGKDGKLEGLAAFKTEIDAAKKSVQDALTQLDPASSPTLKAWLDDLDPEHKGKAQALLRGMEALARGVENTASRLFGSTDPETGTQTPGQVEAILSQHLTLDDNNQDAPLTQVKDAIAKVINTRFDELTATVAKAGKLPGIGAQVPKDGDTHEDTVRAALSTFVGQHGHVASVGTSPGKLGKSKWGDFVVTLDDGHTRICVEAKSHDKPKGEPLEYLRDCAKNRGCQFTIFAASDSQTMQDWFGASSWVWSDVDACIATTTEYLDVALQAAKISLHVRDQEGEAQISEGAIKAEATNLASLLTTLGTILQVANTVKTSAEKHANRIRTEARRMVTQIRDSINNMRAMVGLPIDESLGQDLLKREAKPKEDAAVGSAQDAVTPKTDEPF